MEEIFQAVVKLDLDEDQFWSSTPYLTGLRIKAKQRGVLERCLMTGWMSERFAREDRLQGPMGYIKQFLDPVDPAEAEAQAEAMFHRMAADWGLEIEPLVEDDKPA